MGEYLLAARTAVLRKVFLSVTSSSSLKVLTETCSVAKPLHPTNKAFLPGARRAPEGSDTLVLWGVNERRHYFFVVNVGKEKKKHDHTKRSTRNDCHTEAKTRHTPQKNNRSNNENTKR